MIKTCLVCNSVINVKLPKYLGSGYKDYCSEKCLVHGRGSLSCREDRHTVRLSNGESQWICGRVHCDICDHIVSNREEEIALSRNDEEENIDSPYDILNNIIEQSQVRNYIPFNPTNEDVDHFNNCQLELCDRCNDYRYNLFNSFRMEDPNDNI